MTHCALVCFLRAALLGFPCHEAAMQTFPGVKTVHCLTRTQIFCHMAPEKILRFCQPQFLEMRYVYGSVIKGVPHVNRMRKESVQGYSESVLLREIEIIIFLPSYFLFFSNLCNFLVIQKARSSQKWLPFKQWDCSMLHLHQ